MQKLIDLLAALPEQRRFRWFVLAAAVLCFALANLPWHLDNYDQAKQAFVAFEIEQTGNWFLQHTPQGKAASKPPLAGWLSLLLYKIWPSWDLAWRLPGFVAGLVLLWILYREGQKLLLGAGGLLVAAAFAWNFLTPRIVTLVRTDMVLTLFIFLCGWLIYRQVASGVPWRRKEMWLFFAAMLAALLTKGPVIYAFLLPGMVLYTIIKWAPEWRWRVWGKSLSIVVFLWVLPLLLFVGWGIYALMQNPDFYQDVVQKEFLSRFQSGDTPDQAGQPVWFYWPHLLHKFLPWTVVFLAVPFCVPAVRRAVREKPELLWLVCWFGAALLVMSLIPSKRVDRIYPLIPVMAWLIGFWAREVWADRRWRACFGATLLSAVLLWAGYYTFLVVEGYVLKNDRLIAFAQAVDTKASKAGVEVVEIVRSPDEGLLLYLQRPRFLSSGEARDLWESRQVRALLVPEKMRDKLDAALGNRLPALESGEINKNEKRYYLFLQ